MTLYQVIPEKQKDSILLKYEVTQEVNNETWRVLITEHHDSGHGMIETDNIDSLSPLDDIRCDPILGWGLYRTTLDPFDFEFSENITEDAINEFKNVYLNGDGEGRDRFGWLLEGTHNWTVVSETITVLGPVKFEEHIPELPPEINTP